MRTLNQTIRTTVLYIVSVVLIGSIPMATYADSSDACAGTGHFSDRWITDPTTGSCVKMYDKDGTYVGPSYLAPAPNPTQQVPPSDPAPAPVVNETTPPVADQGVDATVNDSGDNNNTEASNDTAVDSATNVDATTNVNSDVKSVAISGDAKVKGNESSGSATSGNADVNATVVNSVHSTVDGGSGVATFSYDIDGNVVGDITLSGSGNAVDLSKNTDVTNELNVNNQTALQNGVDLAAISGGANVEGNESSGSATSGNANAVANILNLINTIIAANQSFVGTINIYGNLNGDILISPEFIPQIIATNANSIYNTSNLALTTNINDDTSIVNNVDLTATSGNANVLGNESGGSATSGNTQTNLTILNLTGHQVTAANSLLIFVNVLGTWVGMIVDAPGATAAAIGSGVTGSNVLNVSSAAELNNKSTITNNVSLAAHTGDATVDGNESGGSATSGNATASANIANISTSMFDLTGWFGVLYINVFGSWIGSFGVDTEAGRVIPIAGDAASSGFVVNGRPNMAFGFVPKDTVVPTAKALGVTPMNPGGNDPQYTAAVLASAATNGGNGDDTTNGSATLIPTMSPREDPFSTVMMVAGFGVAASYGAWAAVRRWAEYRSSIKTV